MRQVVIKRLCCCLNRWITYLEAELEQFYEDLQNLLDLTPKKDVLFIIGYWNAKVVSQETTGVNRLNLALEYGMKQGKD